MNRQMSKSAKILIVFSRISFAFAGTLVAFLLLGYGYQQWLGGSSSSLLWFFLAGLVGGVGATYRFALEAIKMLAEDVDRPE